MIVAQINQLTSDSSTITVEDILIDVCTIFNEDIRDVIENGRFKNLVICKKIYIYVAKELTPFPFRLIGKLIRSDHSSCVHHRNDVRNFLRLKDPSFLFYWDQYIQKSKIWPKEIFPRLPETHMPALIQKT